jgi:hypothetical protein
VSVIAGISVVGFTALVLLLPANVWPVASFQYA